MHSTSIQKLIKALSRLPSVGPRTAERFVFHLLKSGKKDAAELTIALKEMLDSIKSCTICWRFSDQDACNICTDTKRDHKIICVVSEQQEVEVFEKLGEFTGVYHILRGTIKPENDFHNKKLKIKELLLRLRSNAVDEVILGLNANIEGETTIMFLERKIKEISPLTKITRLARGLPMGSDLLYADEITLASALKNRK